MPKKLTPPASTQQVTHIRFRPSGWTSQAVVKKLMRLFCLVTARVCVETDGGTGGCVYKWCQYHLYSSF
ncbi:hypothetical protein IF2G_02769 [Cordyceps javanica]|nr:hypothetical protein IF2G_02769 [Cordyceps javanica]